MFHAKNYEAALQKIDGTLVYNLEMIRQAEFRNVQINMLSKHHYLFYLNDDYKAMVHIVETPFKHCTVQVSFQERVQEIWVQVEDWMID